MAERTAYNYAISIGVCETIAKEQGYDNWHLYSEDANAVLTTIGQLRNDAVFIEKNSQVDYNNTKKFLLELKSNCSEKYSSSNNNESTKKIKKDLVTKNNITKKKSKAQKKSATSTIAQFFI